MLSLGDRRSLEAALEVAVVVVKSGSLEIYDIMSIVTFPPFASLFTTALVLLQAEVCTARACTVVVVHFPRTGASLEISTAIIRVVRLGSEDASDPPSA